MRLRCSCGVVSKPIKSNSRDDIKTDDNLEKFKYNGEWYHSKRWAGIPFCCPGTVVVEEVETPSS